MDVKSAFLYGKIKEEVYVCQPLWFEDPEFPDKMRPDRKYVDEILKKFGFSTVKTASTPMETSKPLLKDAKAEDVDVHLYRLKIGSLMYLTASRPDIMFADSPFDLEAYTNNDYANASLARKSTTGSSDETVIKKWEDIMERVATIASILEAKQDSVNASVSKLMLLSLNLLLPVLVYAARHSLTAVRHKLMLLGITSYCWKKQRKDSSPIEPIPNKATNEKHVSTLSYDLPQSGEDRLQLTELMSLCTSLQEKVLDLEKAKSAQTKEIATLKKRVKNDEEMLFDVQDDLQGEEVVAEKEVAEKNTSTTTIDELEQEKAKKKKGDDDKEKEEMKKHMKIVQDDEVEIDAIPLATKPPMIVEYKIDKEGKIGYFKLIRADGSSKRYSSMIQMLQGINREYLETLWKLVKAKHGLRRPEEDYERVLWVDLKVMFEPDVESKVWRNLQGYNVIVWKLFSSSGVHFVRF
ncbi:uncharacterized mitochondrial protein-like protein [Tanacetum coccineum]